jgi:hypothetical protein
MRNDPLGMVVESQVQVKSKSSHCVATLFCATKKRYSSSKDKGNAKQSISGEVATSGPYLQDQSQITKKFQL